MTTVVSVAQGGTGANSAALARTALGAAPLAAYDAANNAYAAANTGNLLAGGVITGTLNVTQDIIVGGNVYLEGNTTFINVATYSIEDSLMYLASNNSLTDSVDIGIMGGKNTSGTYSHTGFARDATDGKWKLFDGLPEEGHVGNVVNFANTYLATLVANVEANTLSVVNGVSGNVNFDSGTLFVDSVGNEVGIGNVDPNNARLHVAGNNTTPDLSTTSVLNASAVLGNSDRDYGTYFATYGSGTGAIQQRRGVTAVYYDLLLQPHGGNVGIGTGVASYKLHTVGKIYSTTEVQGGTGIVGTIPYSGTDFAGFGSNSVTKGLWLARDFANTYADLVIANTGNVGIGTATAAYTLDLLSSTAGYVARFKSSGNYGGVLADAGSSGSAGGGYFAVAKNGSRSGLIGVSGSYLGDSSTDLTISSESGKDIKFYTNGSSTLSVAINTSGNVGIGTSNAQVPLHVNRSGSSGSQTIVLGLSSVSLRPIIQFSEGTDVNSGTGMAIEYDGRGSGGTNAIRFNSVDNVPVQTFMSNGWVGFGNTSPTAPLLIQHTNLPGEPYSGIIIKNTDTTGSAYTGVTADGVLQSHYRFAINGSTKWQWRCGAGSGLDDLRLYSFTLGDDVMTVNNSGKINFKYQPAFHAYGGQGVPNNYVTYPSVYTNRGSHYSTSTGRFTAPVAGLYCFFWDAIGSTSSDVHRWYLRKNGTTVGAGDLHLRQDTNATGSEYATNGSRVVVLELAASDYVQIFYTADNGTTSYAGADYVTFGGYLLG